MDFKRINKLYKGYSGFRGKWLESINYSIFSSFDEKQQGFVCIYDKDNKKIIAKGISLYLTDSRLIIPYLPYFSTVNPSENCFFTVITKHELINFIAKDSPFFGLVNKEESESNFLVKISL